MKIKLLLFHFLLCLAANAQVSGVVIDKNTKEPVPYVTVWVDGEDTATTSDEEGKFALPPTDAGKQVIFSSLGYGTLAVPVKELRETVVLAPTVTELPEIAVGRRGEHLFSMGKFEEKEIEQRFGCNSRPWIIARFFAYDKAYDATPYLTNLKFSTRSDIRNAIFNVRLYLPDENGKPGSNIYEGQILGKAKKGKRITEVDLSSLNIRFPEEGFFVAIEWLMIENNRTSNIDDNARYAPSFGAIYDKTGSSWINYFSTKGWSNRKKEEAEKGPYSCLQPNLRFLIDSRIRGHIRHFGVSLQYKPPLLYI